VVLPGRLSAFPSEGERHETSSSTTHVRNRRRRCSAHPAPRRYGVALLTFGLEATHGLPELWNSESGWQEILWRLRSVAATLLCRVRR